MEERYREIENIGNTQEEAIINSLLTAEKSREIERCLKYLHPRSKRAGVNRLRIESPDAEGKYHPPSKEITSRVGLEKVSTEDISSRSILSEDIPPMTDPLVQRLSYNGMT